MERIIINRQTRETPKNRDIKIKIRIGYTGKKGDGKN